MRGMVRRTDGVSGVSQEDFLRGRDETRKSDPSVEDWDFIETGGGGGSSSLSHQTSRT